ncbi:endolytic peptidoglycan transglycosylase RlpA [Erwinia sp. BNK-24-b]|uniref:endolytic peptidoglycan transglycosylase RlpA n=1 Tax=Erwinia TaxID=551 RepID=UPI001FED8489|nr:endolytic peptidoglycan transglycosylase RlpA [Erwinia phyllosphaerae]MBV4368631.1 endolytic peptidoglycan transglycosylase RlpA [Erwinia phyllosphaerae]
MRKDWLWIGLTAALLAGCTTEQQQAPVTQQQAYNGPVVEIGGVEPRYEPLSPNANQDYRVNGQNYRIVKNPDNFSETGLASWYGEEADGTRTAIGETYDSQALTAAHPTLPLPAYVRVTNLANGRQIVVRVNDRGPYKPGRIIDLSKAAGDRLNISNNSRVKVDYIKVAPDGSLSGPGTIGTTVAKQNYALPPRPDLSGGMVTMGAAAVDPSSASTQPAATPAEPATRPVDNSTLSSDDNMGAPVRSSGFLGAPQPLPNGVLEGNEPEPAPVAAPQTAAPVAAPAPVAAAPVAATGGTVYVVQAGALSDATRAQQLMTSLSKKFGVPGSVDARGNVYRVQLGHFTSRQQAAALQQRLSSEASLTSFVTTASGKM